MENKAIFKIQNDVEADGLISEIHELEADKKRFEMIFKARMDQLQQDLSREVETIEKQISFNKGMLQAYFLTVPAKETKTARSYKLLSGKLVMKKASVKLVHDDKALLSWVKGNNATEFIKTKEELNWTKLKDTLIIKDDAIITDQGEVIDIEGLKLEQVAEQFEIK